MATGLAWEQDCWQPLLLLFALPALHAQTTAQISGTVTDTTGAVIPGATVTLVNEATQDTRVVKSNGDGLYSFPALLPSSYTIKVTAKGFEPKNLTGLVLHAGDERAVPALTLAIGSEIADRDGRSRGRDDPAG